jgi:hypothetical protein
MELLPNRKDLGFRVQGSGFRVQGSGFRVQGSGFRVQQNLSFLLFLSREVDGTCALLPVPGREAGRGNPVPKQ